MGVREDFLSLLSADSRRLAEASLVFPVAYAAAQKIANSTADQIESTARELSLTTEIPGWSQEEVESELFLELRQQVFARLQGIV